jgi:hypothetical protein
MLDAEDSPRGRALAWWKVRAEAHEYVLGRDALPGAVETAILRDEGYVLPVAGGLVWIVARPGVDVLPGAFYPNYWKVVRLVMDAYAPAAVERVSAVRLHSEMTTPPAVLTVRQGASASRRSIELVPGYEVQVRGGTVDAGLVVPRPVEGVEIPTDDPAATLLALPATALRDDPETVSVWLKSLTVARPELEAAYERSPRPVVLKRIGLLARELGNDRLAQQIDEVIRGGTRHRVGRGHTGRAPTFAIPAYLAALQTTRQPWLDRQAAVFARYADAVEREIGAAEAELPRFTIPELLRHAGEAKAYDAYHSTTIEGYRISPAEVSAVVSGAPVAGHDPESVRSRMAVAGYSRAFETVLARVAGAGGRVEMDESLIQELYLELFSPSVDAGLVSPEVLRGWRNQPAYLREHTHVPPAPDKLPMLMRRFADLANGIQGQPLVRAVMAHYEFVTVHPFPDGNGRIARFLLNLALLGEGLPWTTIRVDDRARYFRTLHQAQVENDPLPFARLVLGYVQDAAAVLR